MVVDSEHKREAREAHQALVAKRDQGRAAVQTTLKTIEKFGEDFHALVAKSDKEIDDAVRQVKSALPADMKEAAMAFVQMPPPKEIAEAIAYTNQLFSAAAAAAVPSAVVPTGTNAVANAAGTNAVANVAGTNAVSKVADSAKKAEAKSAEEAPVAEGEETKEEVKEEEIALPSAVKQFAELWADVYACRAADIRVQGHVKFLTEKGKELSKFTGEDEATVKAIAKLAQVLVEGFEQMKGMKCVEQTQRKAAVIRTRSTSLVRSAQQQIKRMVDKAERIAKAKAEKAAKEAAAAKAAEERKAKVEEETKAAQEKFDNLVGDRLKSLDWEPALKQLQRLLDDCETPEGKDEVRSQMAKVEYMRELQKVFVAKAKGFKMNHGDVEVANVNMKTITLQQYAKKKGKRNAVGRPQQIEWRRFYGKKENVGYMNQLLNHFVLKGRDTVRTAPLAWSKQMLGAALTLQLLYSEVEGVEKVIPIYVKNAVKGFEDCGKWAKKWFPDIDLEAE